MSQLLADPDNFERHLQRWFRLFSLVFLKSHGGGARYAASVATSVTYGRRVESPDEWIVKENMEAMDCT